MKGTAMKNSFDQALLGHLRCPASGELLELRVFAGSPADGIEAGVLLARGRGLFYPVIGGVAHLLPHATPAMEAFARQWSEEIGTLGGLHLPAPARESSPEEEHFETSGIEGVGGDSFDIGRRAAAVDLVPHEVDSLLDVGAGPGLFLADFETARPHVRTLGLERSGAAIRAARCTSPILMGTANRLPLPDEAVDCVVTMEMLEHLPSAIHEQGLRELARVARRFVLVNVPYRERRLQAECPDCGCVFNPSYHLRSYDGDALTRLLPGFRPLTQRLLPRRENLLKAMAAPWRTRVFGGFTDYAICPQCRYRRPSVPAGTPATRAGGWRSTLHALAARLPRVDVRGEILVLYERKHD